VDVLNGGGKKQFYNRIFSLTFGGASTFSMTWNGTACMLARPETHGMQNLGINDAVVVAENCLP
jgi:hypothetical protein